MQFIIEHIPYLAIAGFLIWAVSRLFWAGAAALGSVHPAVLALIGIVIVIISFLVMAYYGSA